MAKEICVSCGKVTPYEIDTHIDHRQGYIEGLGQLCISCYRKTDGEDTICVPVDMIRDTPNDMELGKKVRLILHGMK
jgi:hypothetical protein